MSNTPNQEPYSNQPPYPNQGPYQNYGNSTPPPPYSGQPQGAYGAPYGYSPNMMPSASRPLPLGEAIRQLPGQYIRVLTKPGAEVFAQEQGKAAWNIIWVQLIAVAILSVLFGFAVNSIVAAALGTQNLPPETVNTLRGPLSGIPFSYIILTPISFFIGVGIYYLLARAFGGRGTFVAFAYCYLLFYVPLTIIEGLVGLIPFLGGLIAFALIIYGIVLQIFMTMAVHRLSGGRATLAVLILPIIAVVLVIILFIVLVAVIAAALHNR